MGLQAKVKEGQLFPSLFSLVPQNQLLKGWDPQCFPAESLQMKVALLEPHDSLRRLDVRAMVLSRQFAPVSENVSR